MNSSRQLLLGTGVFLGGGILLFAMIKQMDTPQADTAEQTPVAVVENSPTDDTDNNMLVPLTADIKTEERILEQRRLEREQKVAELDKRAKKFLEEQERAEALAMKKARLEAEKYHQNATEQANAGITKPVVTARQVETQQSNDANAQTTQQQTAQQQHTDTKKPSAPSSPQQYIVKSGDGFIRVARNHGVPLEALLQANKLSQDSTIFAGQSLVIPAQNQIKRLVREYTENSEKKKSQLQAQQEASKQAEKQTAKQADKQHKKPSSNAPSTPTSYQVKRGDGLIKLAKQYNIPVEALAEANNMSTHSNLRIGQKLTIPSKTQVARLQRQAEEKRQSIEAKREAQRRLTDARRKAASGKAKGTFGVQVTLADNQAKADEIVKKLKAAGYSASTSKTSRGVRVLVGPEKGKDAALALKDKINADPNVGVDNAWVLYWR